MERSNRTVTEKVNVRRKKKTAIEAQPDKLKYPTAVFFIISNEFCERFAYYGMRAILSIYLNYIGYGEDQATMIYHCFVIVCYISPFFGAIIADTWLGRFYTILYLSLWYAGGQLLMAVGAIHSLPLSPTILAFTALAIIGTGTGGIKPCVSAFGGDQFSLPEQEKQLDVFFSVFYFSINAGSTTSSFITPVLRQKVSCFGSEFCFPLAFGLPAFLMVTAVAIFIIGKPLYKIYPRSEGSVAIDVVKCISHAISKRCKGKDDKKDSFLDYANDKYDQKLIDDTKQMGKVALIFAPTIVFWALFEQQGSRWTFQATRMNCYVLGYNVPPEQMQTFNSILVLIFIPLFQAFLYPCLFKLNLVRTPLQKMVVGGYLASLAFVIAAVLETLIERGDPSLPTSGSCHLKIFNSLECPISISSSELEIEQEISAYDVNILKDIKVPSLANQKLDVKYGAGCKDASNNFAITLESKKVITYMLTRDTGAKANLLSIDTTEGKDIERSKNGSPSITALYGKPENLNVELKSVKDIKLPIDNHQSKIEKGVSYTTYTVYINGSEASETVFLKRGGVYALLITDVKLLTFELITITAPATINILWQVPQYAVITAAEVMFSITGLQLGFTQAPLSMRSLVSSLWLMGNGFGSMIVIIIAGLHMFSKQSYEFFLFAAMLALDMGLFVILAIRYTYIQTRSMESLSVTDEK